MSLISGVQLPVDRIADLCRRYGVQELAIFGSAARGDMQPGSDIDILVEFQSSARVGLVKFASLSGPRELARSKSGSRNKAGAEAACAATRFARGPACLRGVIRRSLTTFSWRLE